MTKIPGQYAFLFRLLRDSSAAYTDELAKLEGDYDDVWNPRTARFEVDAYLAFQLSSSLLNLEHNREVWQDMCHLCEATLTRIHEELITSGNLSDVIAARVEGYGRIASRSPNWGRAHTAFVKSLRQHIMASSNDDRVEAEHPLVIGDAFKESALLSEYRGIDLLFAGAFCCVLRHILQCTTDVRMLSDEELTSLAEAGQREATANAARTLDSRARESSGQPKRWWQFWR